MPSGSITSALIRCTRQDSEAEGLFELTQPDLGLWVRELEFTRDSVQAEQIAEICREVQANSARLQKLDQGSADYTLHLTFDLPERERIVLPSSLSGLAYACGFSIELYGTRDEAGESGRGGRRS